MDDSAPITWLINQVNTVVSAGADTVAASLAYTIMPLVSIGFGIYILLILMNYMRGAEDAPVIDFLLRIASFGVIVTMGLNADVYAAVVLPIVTGLGSDLADAVSGGIPGASTLDQLALKYLGIINKGFEYAASQKGIDKMAAYIFIGLKSIIIVVGLVPFLVAATVTLIIANVGITIVAMVGPVFFAFLLFPATRQYFSAWLNTCFSYALIPFLVAVVATISVNISDKMLLAGASLNDTSFTRVFLASICNLILLFVLKQVTSIASSLSAGGINAAMPGGIGSAARGAASGAKAGMAAGKATIKGTKKAAEVAGSVINRLRGNTIKPG